MIGLEHHAMCAWSSSRRSALTSPSRPRLPGGSTQLHGWGYAAIVAAAVTADFWAALAVGRLGSGRLVARWSAHRLIIDGPCVSLVLLLDASDQDLAPLMYPLLGFAIAAVFPLDLHWFTELSPGDHIGVGWLILVDMVAGVVGSGTQYAAVAVASLRVIPFVAAGFAALCIVSFALALRLPTVSPRSSGASRGAPKVQ
jgi:hypothetical protein